MVGDDEDPFDGDGDALVLEERPEERERVTVSGLAHVGARKAR